MNWWRLFLIKRAEKKLGKLIENLTFLTSGESRAMYEEWLKTLGRSRRRRKGGNFKKTTGWELFG